MPKLEVNEVSDRLAAQELAKQPFEESTPELWCYCFEPDTGGSYVNCAGSDGQGKDCEYNGWVHLQCAGLSETPKCQDWWCQGCRPKYGPKEPPKGKVDRKMAARRRNQLAMKQAAQQNMGSADQQSPWVEGRKARKANGRTGNTRGRTRGRGRAKGRGRGRATKRKGSPAVKRERVKRRRKKPKPSDVTYTDRPKRFVDSSESEASQGSASADESSSDEPLSQAVKRKRAKRKSKPAPDSAEALLKNFASVQVLRDWLKKRNLKWTGKKEQLIGRIREAAEEERKSKTLQNYKFKLQSGQWHYYKQLKSFIKDNKGKIVKLDSFATHYLCQDFVEGSGEHAKGYNFAILEMTRRGRDWRPIFADMVWFIEHKIPIVMCPSFADGNTEVDLKKFKEAIEMGEDTAKEWINDDLDLQGKLNLIFEGLLDWSPLKAVREGRPLTPAISHE